MSYVKNYDVGQIKLDLPHANYIHELPLLSFSDIQNTVNLSLVFNYERHTEDVAANRNLFSIAPGYKLNLQKKILFNENNVPIKLCESSGKLVDLRGSIPPLTFDDDSQRILRRIQLSGTNSATPDSNEITPSDGLTIYNYIVEYPDFGKEVYDSGGKIIEVYDKYNTTPYLTYAYNEYSRLTSVTYRGSKVISFSYESNQLKTVTYGECESTFNYNTDGTLNSIEHYTGVVYTFDYSNDYTINAGDDVDEAINSSTVSRDTANKTISLRDHYENVVTYKFNSSIGLNDSDNNIVEVTDNLGAKTRYQYSYDKMLYSYGVNDDVAFIENHFAGSVNIHRTLDDVDTQTVSGVLTIKDGMNMWPETPGLPTLTYSDSNTEFDEGYYLLTGWAKNKNDIANADENFVCISDNPYYGFNETEFWVHATPTMQWYFFAYKFHKDYSTVYVYPKNSVSLELKDVRITFLPTTPSEEDYNSHINFSEYLLFNGTEEIPLTDAMYFYNKSGSNYLIEDKVTVSDIMKYKLRKKREGACNEIYVDDCKTVVTGTTDLNIFHKENYISISNFELATRTYSKNKTSFTVINVDENNTSTDIEKVCTEKAHAEGATEKEVLRECFDNNLDVKTATSYGVTTEYERNSQGFVTKEVVSGLYRHDTVYTDTLVTVKDVDVATGETLSTTKYHFDSTWGGVYKIAVLDKNDAVMSVITDTYDGDMGTLMQKAFDINSSRKNTFSYLNGKLASVSDGTLNYSFAYTAEKGDLESVSKNGTSIEHHTYEEDSGETTVTSKYPSNESTIYTQKRIFDKYGKLKSIDGVLVNTYRVWPTFDDTTGELTTEADNAGSLLAMSNDLLRGQTARYKYDNEGRIVEKTVTGSSDFSDKISSETFVYDNNGRLIDDNCVYNQDTASSVTSKIEYVNDSTATTVEERVKKYTYKHNGYVKATTDNTYDAYKRIQKKQYKLGNTYFVKELEYDKTKLSRVVDKKTSVANNDNIFSDVRYEYDVMGRVICEKDGNNSVLKSYVYDMYGQLIRENNKTLDKTFIYEYNSIGNLTAVKSYNYTAGAVSGTPGTTALGYTNDKLTTFGGKAITYNSNGGVASYDGWDYTWSKGKLSTIRMEYGGSARLPGGVTKPTLKNSKTYSYTYNAQGQRVKSTYSHLFNTDSIASVDIGEVTAYTKIYSYDSFGRLISVSTTETIYGEGTVTSEIVFLYDQGSMVGMQYTSPTNGTNVYYYLRNLQGDVIGIYDTSGNLKVKYNYDAWGNCTVASETTSIALANVNPIRYRGYYFDRETGLYYLNARYYSPEWRRFISPDDTAYLDPETPNGLNLYAYCYNDPVNYADPSGHEVISLLVGVLIGGLVSWGLSELFGEHLVTGAGLAFTGGAAISSGVMALTLATPVGWVVGGITVIAGVFTLAFASAELLQHFTGDNWMLDGGMSESVYYTLMSVSSFIASVGTAASSIATCYEIDSVIQKGRINGRMKSGKYIDGYRGLRFSSKTGKVYSLEFHPRHNNHGVHIQWNQWFTTYAKYHGEYVLNPKWRLRLW